MTNKNIEINIFYGSVSDLTKIDLHYINAKIVVYKGTKFRNAFKNFTTAEDFKRSYTFATDRTDEDTFYVSKSIKLYAIIPLDIVKPFENEDIVHFYQMLLAIFPSDLSIVKTIYLSQNNDYFSCDSISVYTFKSTGERFIENFLYIHKTEFRYTRNFIKKYFKSAKQLKYLKYILSLYSNSFLENNSIYQFISLIICLEVIVEGKEQLTYRIKRNTAILCGNDIESCKLIYKNVAQLYTLRSAILHGEIKPSYKNFKEYHRYLIKLVAKLIRELIVHNISTMTELNDKLTAAGYSQNYLLSENYVSSKYPIIDNIKLNYNAIQKYKA